MGNKCALEWLPGRMNLVIQYRQSDLTDAAWCESLPAVFTMKLPVCVKKPARYRSLLEKLATLTLYSINRM